MGNNIELEGQFSYSLTPVIISGVILLIFITIVISMWVAIKRKKRPQNVEANIKTPTKSLAEIKKEYLEKCAVLEGQKISVRAGYQNLSKIVRGFLLEAARIDFTKSTLMEIDEKRYPVVHKIMQEFYHPEFAEKAQADFNRSLIEVEEMIRKWK